MTLEDLVRSAAAKGCRVASGYPASASRDRLPWSIIEPFDADVRGRVERDPRIEDERDRVLIAAVKLAEAEDEGAAAARRHLIDAIGYLEQAVLRFGIVNRAASRLGYGEAGQRLSAQR